MKSKPKVYLGISNIVDAKSLNRDYVKIDDLEQIKRDLEISELREELFPWLDSRCRWWPYYFVSNKKESEKIRKSIKKMVYGEGAKAKIAERKAFYNNAEEIRKKIKSLPNKLINEKKWLGIFTNEKEKICESSYWMAKTLRRDKKNWFKRRTRLEILELILTQKKPKAPEKLKKAAARSLLLELLFGYTIDDGKKVKKGIDPNYLKKIKNILKKAKKQIPPQYNFVFEIDYTAPKYAKLIENKKEEKKRVLAGFKIYNFYKLYWRTPLFKEQNKANKQ